LSEQFCWPTSTLSFNPEWGNYKLHNFSLGKEHTVKDSKKPNVRKITLSLYEMNKDGEMYNSQHPYFKF